MTDNPPWRAARLEAAALACERNSRRVFDDVSFTLAAGQLLEVRGPNGSGKSSLLRVIAGLLPKAAGSLVFEGGAPDLDQDHGIAPYIHLIGHGDAVKPALTVRENLEFWAAMLGGKDIAKGLATFALTALAGEPALLLSAGQRRRLALSRLAAAERPLWLLDEPMTALDAAAQAALANLVTTHLRHGGMAIAATHSGLGIDPDHVVTLTGGSVRQ